MADVGSKRAITDAGCTSETGGDAGSDRETARCNEETEDSDDEAAGASLTGSNVGANGINAGRMTSDKGSDKLASFNASELGRSETDSNKFT